MAVDAETISSPATYTKRSPSRCTSNPVGGAEKSRITEKIVIENVTAPRLTPNVRAKAGNPGDPPPEPSAAPAFAAISTQASRGSLVDLRPQPPKRERRVARVTR